MTDLAVATVTLARDDGEETLLRQALARLASCGPRVFVADGGSRAAFVDYLRVLPNLTVAPADARGLVGQARASLRAAAASGAPIVLYTEPDKEAFFARDLMPFLERAPAGPEVGIVIASRSAASFATYPPMQRCVETAVNDLTGALVASPGDYSYGPFLLRAELAAYLERVPVEIGWGWRPFLFITAHRLGFRLHHVEGELACPPEQRDEDDAERVHRLRQLSQNAAGLALALGASEQRWR